MKNTLEKLWAGWKRVAHKIARVQTIILITIFYFLILAPLGGIARLFGWNPLETNGFKLHKLTNWKKTAMPSPDLESLKRQS
jgi:hypothetical protein